MKYLPLVTALGLGFGLAGCATETPTTGEKLVREEAYAPVGTFIPRKNGTGLGLRRLLPSTRPRSRTRAPCSPTESQGCPRPADPVAPSIEQTPGSAGAPGFLRPAFTHRG